jgi:hypothetical protein
LAANAHTGLVLQPGSESLRCQRSIVTRLHRDGPETLVSPNAVNHNVLHASFVLRHHLASLATHPDLASLSQPHRPADHHPSLDPKGPSPNRLVSIQDAVANPNPGLRPLGNLIIQISPLCWILLAPFNVK